VKVPQESSHIATDAFDAIEDFFAMPSFSKRGYSRKYAKAERRGYWRQLGREIFEVCNYIINLISRCDLSETIKKTSNGLTFNIFNHGVKPLINFTTVWRVPFLVTTALSFVTNKELVAEGVNLPKSYFDNFVDDPDTLSPSSFSSSMLRIHRYSSALKPLFVNLVEPFLESEKRPHADIGKKRHLLTCSFS
jgi:isopenicillin N synthase-like dioxygenase